MWKSIHNPVFQAVEFHGSKKKTDARFQRLAWRKKRRSLRKKELRILDLGGGVGRNCIPFAQEYHDISCKIERVDLLDLAIEKLCENAREYQVDSYIEGIVMPIEEYFISENSYDFIMAISALEHVATEAALLKKLEKIRRGIRENGIVELTTNVVTYVARKRGIVV